MSILKALENLRGKIYSPIEDLLYINSISMMIKGKLRRKRKIYNHLCILLGKIQKVIDFCQINLYFKLNI